MLRLTQFSRSNHLKGIFVMIERATKFRVPALQDILENAFENAADDSSRVEPAMTSGSTVHMLRRLAIVGCYKTLENLSRTHFWHT